MKRPLCWLLALCLSLCSLGGWAETELKRILDPAELGEWSAVGRVNLAGQGFCTGALIAPDLVLTAAHCLFHPRSGRLLPPDRMHFVAGQIRSTWLADSGGAAHAFVGDWRKDRRNDVALLRLENPLKGDGIHPYSVGQNTGDQVVLASYGKGRAFALAVQDSCAVTQKRQGVLLLDCLAAQGTSGAPVFVRNADGALTVVAVISATVQTPQGQRAVAVPITSRNLEVLRGMLLGKNGRRGADSMDTT